MALFVIRAILVLIALIPLSIFGIYVYNGVVEVSKKSKAQLKSEMKEFLFGLVFFVVIVIVLVYFIYPALLTIMQVVGPYLSKLWAYLSKLWEIFRYNQSQIKI